MLFEVRFVTKVRKQIRFGLTMVRKTLSSESSLVTKVSPGSFKLIPRSYGLFYNL